MEQEYILSKSGEDVDKTLQSAFVTAEVLNSPSSIGIQYFDVDKRRVAGITINAATTTMAGLVTAAMYKDIYDTKSKVDALPRVITGSRVETDYSSIDVYMTSGDDDVYSFTIDAATDEHAGLLTPAGLKIVENAPIMLVAESVVDVGIEEKPELELIDGRICFDILQKMILLNIEGVYYREWTSSNAQIGISSTKCNEKNVFISVDGDIYTYTGVTWRNLTPIQELNNIETLSRSMKELRYVGEVDVDTQGHIVTDFDENNLYIGLTFGRLTLLYKQKIGIINPTYKYYSVWETNDGVNDSHTLSKPEKIYLSNGMILQGAGGVNSELVPIGSSQIRHQILSEEEYQSLCPENGRTDKRDAFTIYMTY